MVFVVDQAGFADRDFAAAVAQACWFAGQADLDQGFAVAAARVAVDSGSVAVADQIASDLAAVGQVVAD